MNEAMQQISKAEAFADLCRARGIRLTGQRRAIAEIIVNARDHPCADTIYALVTKKHPRISLATVYRTMRTLRNAGLVEEHSFGEGRTHYEFASDGHHDHLIDTSNGNIIEFRDPEIEELQRTIAARLGYRLVGYKLELYGAPEDDELSQVPMRPA